jgi:phenylalanyl-tRNA synthetase alpha chain
MPEKIIIYSEEEDKLRKDLEKRHDAESERMKRYLNMPDLSRTKDSPLQEMVERILSIPQFKEFDTIQAPEIVRADLSFDLFNFPPNHPARSRSDTYYVDDQNILRTHTTIMWYYYLKHPAILEKIKQGKELPVFSWGKVYRKDEIDRKHMNIFHQFDGLYLRSNKDKPLTIDDLKSALTDIAKAIYGNDIEVRFNKDTFPYTDPSLEMEIKKGGDWLEILGSGMVQPSVLEKLGLDPDSYHGWAFGSGLERWAILSMALPDIRLLWSQDPRVKKQLQLGQKFQEVSKFPPITRDISFVVSKDFVPNNYFDLIRDIGGDLVEQVELLDKYENAEKFGADKVSYTYRVVYRSPERTLTASEVEPLQAKLYAETKAQYGAELR